MPTISPIAQYLRVNKAIPKRDNFGCHFYSPEGLYLGRLTKGVVNNYRIINLETFGEGFKKMFTKSVAIGQSFIYAKNESAPIGVSVLPAKTYMRKIFVDFIEGKSKVEDREKTLTNKLDLIAIDKATGVGLYDTNKPYNYSVSVNNSRQERIKHPKFKYTVN